MATRYNYTGGIVTNGLVLNLDAAKADSYPGIGTAWNDLSGNNNNGTLTNAPTFSGIGKQASIVFDGVDDYVGTSNIPATSNFSYDFTINTSNLTLSINDLIKGTAAYGGQNITFHSTNNSILFCSTNGSYFVYFTGYNWFTDKGLHNYIITTEYTSTTTFKLYVDGVLKDTKTEANYNNYLPSFNRISFANGTTYPVYSFRLYNRTLTQTEVSQNFNALRGRYGI